ncbi:hypothetical protein WPG_1584 [Winogradskyella sp. PG-2]|nr:hypothetical protein WPG_1584 [Winogradskyella sp. PG-2]
MRTKKRQLSTDYFFESLFRKTKGLIISYVPSKLVALRVLAIITWFKDIN